MTRPDPDPDAPLIPIVLGVVGHRDLREMDTDALRAALKAVFDEFDAAYKGSPKLLLSPLAPGADQLAAAVALEQGPLWSVRAPLALPPDLFLESTAFRLKHLQSDANPDGVDADAKDAFAAFLRNPRVEWFVVPLPGEVSVAGRTATRRGRDWVLSPAAVGEPEETLDWRAMVTADKASQPAHAAFRAACYANPGGYIVRHCHTLIALWDGGVDVDKPSGTPEVVQFQLGGIAPSYYPWTVHTPLGFDADRGPVIWLRTPRVSGKPTGPVTDVERRVLVPTQADRMYFGESVNVPAVAREVTRWERFRARWSLALGKRQPAAPTPDKDVARPGPWEPPRLRTDCPEYDQFLAACQMIEDFNVEASRLYAGRHTNKEYEKDRLEKADRETEEVFRGASAVPAVGGPLDAWYRRFLRVRETAAHLSGPLATRYERAAKWLFALLFFALLAFHLYAHPPWHTDPATPPQHWWLLLTLFTVLWGGMIVLVVCSWYYRLDDRRHDYRALAEALRVRQAYAAAGVSRSVADSYLGQLRTELSWVRRALQHICPPPEYWAEQFNTLTAAEQLDRLRWVKKRWVAGQEDQHRRRRDDKHKAAGRARRRGLTLAAFGLFFLTGVPHGALVWAETGGGLAAGRPSPAPHPVASASTAKSGSKATAKAVVPPADETASEREPDGPAVKDWVSRTLHPSHPPNGLLLVGTMLIILGGVFVAVCDRLGHEQLAKQYDQLYVVFRGGGRELTAALEPDTLPPPHPRGAPPDVARAQRVIEELGREAVQENAQWLLLLRSKPLELPLGA